MSEDRNGTGSRGDRVYRALRQAIIEQALLPGDKLPEDVIGERFGVSRTIVRSAFARLSGEGLIDLVPNRGAAVSRPSLDEAHDIFSVRRALEREVAQRLAERISPEDLALLQAHVKREQAAEAAPEAIRLAGEFHTLLADISGSVVLARYVNELVSRCSLILALYGRPHSSDCAVNEHLEICAALGNHDAETAIRLMDEHLTAVTDRALLPDAKGRQRDLRAILDRYTA